MLTTDSKLDDLYSLVPFNLLTNPQYVKKALFKDHRDLEFLALRSLILIFKAIMRMVSSLNLIHCLIELMTFFQFCLLGESIIEPLISKTIIFTLNPMAFQLHFCPRKRSINTRTNQL